MYCSVVVFDGERAAVATFPVWMRRRILSAMPDCGCEITHRYRGLGPLVYRSFQGGLDPGIIAVMTDGATTDTIPGDAPTAVELRGAVHGGDIDLVKSLMAGNADLARARFVARGRSGTALHFVTDWPGYFPNGPAVVHLLIDAGADPNATTTGPGKPETPLHYAASSDAVDVAVALINRGSDLETPDGSIGTPPHTATG